MRPPLACASLLTCGSLLACASQPRPPSREPVPAATEQAPARAAAEVITGPMLEATVRELASDRLQGRGPGSKGDAAARLYLASRLHQLGYAPAMPKGRWEQPFPIVGVQTAMPPTWSFQHRAGQTVSFSWWEEYMAASGVQRSQGAVQNAEVVFVGYGIVAPEQAWDDFKGVDVRGKILLMLNDDPDWDPALFGGKRKLYYGRWTYKYESAARAGAAGAIIIHTTPSAGYPWRVVQNSWAGWQFDLPAGDEHRLEVQGWLTEHAAAELTALGGHSLSQLVKQARSREFRPVPLGVTTSIQFTNQLQHTQTANVAGWLQGSDPELREQVVIFTAHHDHLGVGKPENGDAIYNGARDNASGVAQALAVAEAFARLEQPPRRSVMFLLVGAEEQGLLGSLYYTRHPTFAPGRIAANINFELGNIWGRTHDVVVAGRGKSTLEDVLEKYAALQQRVVEPAPDPAAGWYYRSDQFSFARIGVPALWFMQGRNFVGRPPGWGDEVVGGWINERYHRPSDELTDDWVFDGMVEDARLAFLVGLEVANADAMPSWYPGDEFESVRKAALAELE